MIWNEAGNGDFSGNGLAPTLLLLGAAVLMCSGLAGLIALRRRRVTA